MTAAAAGREVVNGSLFLSSIPHLLCLNHFYVFGAKFFGNLSVGPISAVVGTFLTG